jgi:hypothetical protein
MVRKCFISGGVIGFARTPLAMLSETDRVGLLRSLQRCNAEGFYFYIDYEVIRNMNHLNIGHFLHALPFFL